jgi:hypothetical protein
MIGRVWIYESRGNETRLFGEDGHVIIVSTERYLQDYRDLMVYQPPTADNLDVASDRDLITIITIISRS